MFKIQMEAIKFSILYEVHVRRQGHFLALLKTLDHESIL